MLLTSNLRTIDRIEINKWAVGHAHDWERPAEPVIYDADQQFVHWTHWTANDNGLDRWIQAGFLACWPRSDNASAETVLDETR